MQLYIQLLDCVHPKGYNEDDTISPAQQRLVSMAFETELSKKDKLAKGADLRAGGANLYAWAVDNESEAENECTAAEKECKAWVDAVMAGKTPHRP